MTALLSPVTVRTLLTTVLVVTGARSHADAPDSYARRAWVEGAVLRELLLRHVSVLVVGDARGPDRWAAAVALSLGLRVAVYEAQSGLIEIIDGQTLAHVVRPWGDVRGMDPRARPIARNEAMIEYVAETYPSAHTLAFPDVASRTHGTERTMKHARRCELAVVAHVWGLSNETPEAA